MYGGALYNTLNLNNESDILNKYQTIIKTKDLFNQRKIETKNKSLLDKIKITNTKNQNAEYLIKYFEGMILNYINMYESKGENMDELKKFILNEDKYDKFKKENNNITNTLKGGYDSDDTNNSSNILLSMNDIDNNWGNIKIEYCRLYEKSLTEIQKQRREVFLAWYYEQRKRIDEIKSKPLSEITLKDQEFVKNIEEKLSYMEWL